MATFSSLGIGSNLDLNSLLDGLMKVERQPITQLQKQQTGLKSQLSALGQVKSALSSLQSAADAIKTPANFAAYKTTVADTAVATATAATGAVGANYSLEVTQLASAQKLSFAFASGTTFSGSLKLEVGKADAAEADGFAAATTKSIDVNGKSLAGVRDAINAAGIGVTATIINEGSGATPYKLVLTSQTGGADNLIRTTGVSSLKYADYAGTDPSPPAGESGKATNASKLANGQNATVKIDGISISRSSNTISDAIDGVTLNLTKTNTGAPTTLSVAKDVDATIEKVKAFVTEYNDLNKVLRDVSAYNVDTKAAAALNGDFSVRTVQQRIRTAAIDTVPGSPGGFARLADAGISLQTNGELKIDTDRLKAALADPAKDVGKLFAGNAADGVAARVASVASALQSSDGVITTRTEGINKSISSLDKRISQIEDRLTIIEARYRRQFTALDTTIGQLNVTSQYLQQQLARLP